jgi:hypothetical protein
MHSAAAADYDRRICCEQYSHRELAKPFDDNRGAGPQYVSPVVGSFPDQCSRWFRSAVRAISKHNPATEAANHLYRIGTATGMVPRCIQKYDTPAYGVFAVCGLGDSEN